MSNNTVIPPAAVRVTAHHGSLTLIRLPNTMAIQSRSQTGCWTCRLRKKKCDEMKPICSTCMSLRLECYTNTEKPDWMDHGTKQRAQLANFKLQVAEVTRRRRINQLCAHRASSRRVPRRNSGTSNSSTNSSTPTTPPTPPNWPVNGQDILNSHTLSDLFPPGWNKMSPVCRNNIMVADSCPGTTISACQTSLDDTATFLSYDHDSEDNLISIQEMQLQFNDFTPESTNPFKCNTCMPLQLPNTNVFVPDNKSVLAIDNIEDAILLAYYIEKVFRWQFKFCVFHLPGFDQGHILWLVSKSRSLYHATLALSSTHKSLQEELTGSPAALAGGEHTIRYDLAIKDIQHDLQDPKSCDHIGVLACITMFLHSTVRRLVFILPCLALTTFQLLRNTRMFDWPVHLQAGTSIITSWIEQKYEPFGYIDDEKDNNHSANESTRVLLIGSIIRFDILSSLTRDSAPVLSETYRSILKTPRYGIHLETVTGCRNWLFNTILDIYSLQDWKKTRKAAGSLSLWELMLKAHAIRESLERDILLNLDQMNKLEQDLESGKHSSTHLEHDISVVTHVFACSVSVLLEVVVAGAHPNLPDIKKEVGRALESYAYIDDLELLHVLRWPLCVAGCVAAPEQRESFRSLLSPTNITWIGTFRETLEFLEEYWEASVDTGASPDDGFNFTQARKHMSSDILIA